MTEVVPRRSTGEPVGTLIPCEATPWRSAGDTIGSVRVAALAPVSGPKRSAGGTIGSTGAAVTVPGSRGVVARRSVGDMIGSVVAAAFVRVSCEVAPIRSTGDTIGSVGAIEVPSGGAVGDGAPVVSRSLIALRISSSLLDFFIRQLHAPFEASRKDRSRGCSTTALAGV